ncbi:hypothetical protein BUALT_Bualt12G0058600 [Buddleja alternifolia]|uniref:Uncharacterized protein n=1 Tax=Buddleja alternifolia TaxID=168488 RepID=A0AAV6WX09_9LAMI|nr:hypothetical protein BUALT_Bualt12G0058600 [Buddleja alternifolia]
METEHNFQAAAFSGRSDDPRELSGSCSGEIKFDLERQPEPTLSNIHPFEDRNDLKKKDDETEVEVELTLSIAHCSSKQKRHDFDQTNRVGEIGSPSSVKINEGPKWLLQDLSLNRT